MVLMEVQTYAIPCPELEIGLPAQARKAADLFRAEAGSLLGLAVPLTAGMLTGVIVGVTNTYFLGPLGAVPLAAVSLTTSIAIILYAATFGLIGPIGYLIGTAYGAGDAAKIAQVVKHGVVLGFAAGLLGFGLMALALLALPYLRQPPEVLAVITPYWLLAGSLMIPFLVSFVYKQFYDAMDRPWTGVALTLAGVAINIPLTWALVGGRLGLPALGLVGAGWAGLISACLGTAIMAAHFHLSPAHAPYRVPSRWSRAAFAEQLREGLPMGVQYFFEGGAVAVAGVLIGWLGAASLAANQVVFSVMVILYMVPMGMSAAVGIRVAQAAGGGGRQRARGIAFSGMGLVSLWTVTFTVLLVTSAGWVARQFVSQADVIAIATLMFVAVGAMQIGDGVQSVGVGALRGIFDNRYPTAVSLIAYWLIALPVSYAFGFWFNWGGPGVWAGFGSGLVVASVLLVRRLLRMTAPAGLAEADC
jgi:MATE family multidrug resistance protein